MDLIESFMNVSQQDGRVGKKGSSWNLNPEWWMLKSTARDKEKEKPTRFENVFHSQDIGWAIAQPVEFKLPVLDILILIHPRLPSISVL
jgi:hypothetical protein